MGTILVRVKPPCREAVSRRMPSDLPLELAARHVAKSSPRNDVERQTQLQMLREMDGPHDYLAIKDRGESRWVDGGTTRLRDIAVMRETQTSRGVQRTAVAAFELQAYADVG